MNEPKDYSNMGEYKRLDDTTLIRVLLLFYIFIAGNMTYNLYSKQLQTFIDENRFAKHFIGFILMLTLIMVIGGVKSIEKGILYSYIGYMWFIFTTKLDLQWNIMIILLLLFGFIYESKVIEKESEIINDQSISDIQKEELINVFHNNKMMIVGTILLVTVIGSFLYINKKEVQYGGSFDIMTFLFY